MSNFKKINIITGWLVFLIATIVYVLTLEPTVSFWDCGEFIAASLKIQIMHPPGAPMFGMIVRMFTLLAGGNEESIAFFANMSSAFSSSFTILFLFWTITHLAKKLFPATEEESTGNNIAIIASGFIGALAYTFSDTFWFSAVETEVYAMSSFFTAIVFWAILKWENVADEPRADRWLVFIAFLMGLSIGVHLLNLLAIPAIAFVYYFRKFEVTKKGVLITSIIAVATLGVFNSLAPTLVSLTAGFDRFFVNTLGLPFFSGAYFFIALLIGGFVYGILYSHKKGKSVLNMALLCAFMAILGFSPYATTVIRSSANPSIDMNDPEDLYSLVSYINREQYGDSPLLKGNHFAVEGKDISSVETNKEDYIRKDGKYVSIGKKVKRKYSNDVQMLFPRIYSHDNPSHVSFYRQWLGLKENQIPTFGDNLRFFFTYQVGHMYFRYFMWNFAGRQNNEQGHGEVDQGNWISGVKFIDAMRLGNQNNLPSKITGNAAHNRLYFLPFILGLLGLFYHYKKNKKDGLVVLMLFFFTGMAIVLYLNQYPLQPRERDYAYVGSFYAYAIWIGLGVLAVYEFGKKYLNPTTASIGSLVICMAVPTLMAAEGWDDHDRSGKYTARDIAKNYLNSCEPNAILFTMGDNDTYPLWYVQEVEGYRTDVRVVNLSLLGTPWYIDHQRRKYYEGDPLPMSIPQSAVIKGNRDYIPLYERIKTHADVDKVVDFVISDSRETKGGRAGQEIDYMPSRKLKLTINKDQVIKSGTVLASDSNLIVDEMTWEIKGNGIFKDDLMILDILATNNWERPIYFATTIGRIGSKEFIGLDKYFRQDGLTYRVVPIENNLLKQGNVRLNTEVMYAHMMNDYVWGNMDTGNIYGDPETTRMTVNLRNHFYNLAAAMYNSGQKDKAMAALEKALEVIPDRNIPYNYSVVQYGEMFYKLQAPEKANPIMEIMAERTEENILYYSTLGGQEQEAVRYSLQREFSIYRSLFMLPKQFGQTELAERLEARFNEMQQEYLSLK
ncbi:MAG: hypothetical protein ACJATA_000665 [Sphingobacteriales bacterium]|jgi:hypothetical protein